MYLSHIVALVLMYSMMCFSYFSSFLLLDFDSILFVYAYIFYVMCAIVML